jgi:hypothetical protein
MTILSDYKSGTGTSKTLGKLRQLVVELKEVLEDEELDWEKKYDLVFDTHQQQVEDLLKEARLHLDYYDPDTTYEEDAKAYVSALDELVK